MTVHLRLQRGYSSKSDSQLHHNCSYHDVVTLHLGLLIGQFVVLHFETLEREKGNKLQVYGKLCEICKHSSFWHTKLQNGTKTEATSSSYSLQEASIVYCAALTCGTGPAGTEIRL